MLFQMGAQTPRFAMVNRLVVEAAAVLDRIHSRAQSGLDTFAAYGVNGHLPAETMRLVYDRACLFIGEGHHRVQRAALAHGMRSSQE